MKDILRKHITERLGREPENIDKVLPHFSELRTKRGQLQNDSILIGV